MTSNPTKVVIMHDYFDKKGDFESYLNDWLNFSEHDLIKKAKPLQRLNTKG